MDRSINTAESGPRYWPGPRSRGGTCGQEGDGVDLDLRVQQQACDLHGGAGGRVFRKELSADAREHRIGAEIGQICFDADDMVHTGAEFAERISDALEGRTHLLFERDAAFVRR